jgi:benzoate 4-monooxygenase
LATVYSTVCAIIYHLAANPGAQRKLQAELDNVLDNSDSDVSHYVDIKSLPYLEACINEAARIHSTTGIGLPRLVPQEGLSAGGKTWVEGTVLSVPTYTIHRDVESWGQDVEVFRPERWAGRVTSRIDINLSSKESTKAFNPFSFGPR